jgi:hypothetical protein
MTLNSTGLGVGGSPAASKVEVYSSNTGTSGLAEANALKVENNNATVGNAAGLFLSQSGNAGCGVAAIATSRTGGSRASALSLYYYNQATSASPIEGARINASGNLLVGTTSSIAGSSHSFKATGTTSSFWAAAFLHEGTTANGRLQIWSIPNANDTGSYFVYASNSGGNCFNVLGNGNVQNTSGTYGTISDLRLKENISDARNYLADLLKLRVVKYSLKSEASAVATKIGFIAQEVEQVFPTLVEINSDEVKSIKTTVLIPMLLKAIQELTARVQTLEAR